MAHIERPTLEDAPRDRLVVIGALYAVLSLLMCARIFANPNGVGWVDWDQHLFYYASVLKSVVEYGQLPFWNPWYCGGNVLWQNPQVALLSPAYPLSLAMSLPLAMKLNIVLHYWVGYLGMHLVLTRVIRLRSLPLTVFLATGFVGCGAVALHLAEGHSTFLPAFYMPLQLYWLCRAVNERSVRHALLAGATFALAILNGGIHIVPLMVVAVAVFGLCASMAARMWRPLLVAILCGVSGLAYSAPKLLPMLTYLNSDRFVDSRDFHFDDSMNFDMVVHAYVGRNQERLTRSPGKAYLWQEYGNYIGWPAAVLLIAALVLIFLKSASQREWLPLTVAVTTVVLFTWSLGQFSSFSPATIARHLPMFSQFRIPSRFTIAFALFAMAAIGCAMRQLDLDAVPASWLRVLITVLCVGATADVMWQNSRHFEFVFDGPPLQRPFEFLRRGPAPVQDVAIDPYSGNAPMLRGLAANRSTFNCYEPLKLQRLTDPAKPLVFGDGPLLVAATRYSPNSIDVRVAASAQPSRLLVNQNYAPGWHSTLGSVSPDPQYQNLSIPVKPDTQGTYTVAFRPPGLFAGFGIFAAAIALSAAAWRRESP